MDEKKARSASAWKYMLAVLAVAVCVGAGWWIGDVVWHGEERFIELSRIRGMPGNRTVSTDPEAIRSRQDNSTFMLVNGVRIPRWQFDNGVWDKIREGKWEKRIPEKEYGKVRKLVAANLRDVELLYQEAVRQGLKVGMAGGELRARIIRRAFPNREEFRLALARAGLTEKQYVELWKKQAAVDRLIREKLEAGVEVTASDIRTYYDEHKQEFSIPGKIRVSRVEMDVPGDGEAAEKEKIKDRMLIIRDRAQGGNLLEVAREYPRARGTDLGWLSEGEAGKEPAAVLFRLKEVQVSPLREKDDKFVLYQCGGIRKNEVPPLKRVKDEVRETLLRENTRAKLDSLLQKLRAEAEVSIPEREGKGDEYSG